MAEPSRYHVSDEVAGVSSGILKNKLGIKSRSNMEKSDFLKIKKSSISSNGVFALKKFVKGERICFMTGEVVSLDEMIRRVDSDEERGSDPLQIASRKYIDMDELSRNFNHSCAPNAFIRGRKELVALKTIKIGEEIFYDYSTTMNDDQKRIEETGGALWTCKCRCGAKKCRGIIDQFKTLPKSFQNFYLKNKLAPDFILKKFR